MRSRAEFDMGYSRNLRTHLSYYFGLESAYTIDALDGTENFFTIKPYRCLAKYVFLLRQLSIEISTPFSWPRLSVFVIF